MADTKSNEGDGDQSTSATVVRANPHFDLVERYFVGLEPGIGVVDNGL